MYNVKHLWFLDFLTMIPILQFYFFPKQHFNNFFYLILFILRLTKIQVYFNKIQEKFYLLLH